MSRTVAEGRIQKLVLIVLAAAAVIGVGTWYPSFAQGYAVKNAGKLACNDQIKQFRYKSPGREEAWREPFLRRATIEGVKLKPNQYAFQVTHEPNVGEYVCKVHITYPYLMEWAFIGNVFALEPLPGVKVLKFEHRVRQNF